MKNTIACAIPLSLVTCLLLSSCGSVTSKGKDGDVDVIDADINAPDADPNAPDADPNAPDANPNAPDAAPAVCRWGSSNWDDCNWAP